MMGARLQSRRLELNMLQRELVRAVIYKSKRPLTESQVSKIEAGKVSPSPFLLAAICAVLGVTVDWALKGDEK